jgi:hypothetical protein
MTNLLGLETARALWGWEPHSEGQRDWLLCNAKVKVGACGRRWGKSESTAIDVALFALERHGASQLILAPSEDQTRIIMGEVSNRLWQIEDAASNLIEKRTPYHTIQIISSSPPSVITARTVGPDGRGLRGRKAHRVIVDEAAYVADSVMESVVGPILADYDGELVLISTPAGRNHFWRAFERGRDPDQPRYRSFQFPSSLNPHLSADYLANEQATKPERVWMVEYLAEFADADGLVFRNVAACCGGDWEEPRAGRLYAAGLDLARVNDYTVLSIVDVASRRLVLLDRYNKIDWPLQVQRVAVACRRYNRASLLVEVNNVGDAILGDIRRAGVNARGFETTVSSKPDLIDALAVAFEQASIHLPDREKAPVLIDEILSYAYQRTGAGYVRMGAPDGSHDDCVVSLALAWRQATAYGSIVTPVAGGARPILDRYRNGLML